MKVKISSIILIFLVLLISISLQVSFFKFMLKIPTIPNLLIIIVVILGFKNDSRMGLLTGLMAGLLLDVSSGSYIGLFALVYMYIGFISGKLNKYYVNDNLTILVCFVGVGDLVYNMIVYIFSFLLRHRFNILDYVVYTILPEVVITIILTLIIYKPLLFFNKYLVNNKYV